jgi:signal transduction histidine kinase
VKAIDRGFQMPPYGDENDDWLRLSADKASRSREWGSTITKSFFPEDERDMSEKNDPLLKVPHNNQLLGAIAVESYRPPTVKKADGQAVAQLQPAMDRQGFVANAGFGQLRDIIRASVELFAVIDVEETSARRRKEAQQAASQARREISKAIERVRQDDTIARPAKAQILSNYERIAAQVTRVEEVQAEARKAVETMSLLGVLSGFMTHETTATLRAVERMQALLKRIPVAQRPTHFDETMEATTAAVEQLKSHIDYAQTFIRGVKKAPDRPFKVLPQMRLVARQMESFCQERGITIRNEIGASLESPKGLPVSVYSGVALNLLTNAIKAILARKDPENATIMFSADSDQAWHWLKVSDTGIGVPDEIGDQIFEPLFTTTGEGPLGLGMGLGLHIVRRVVEEFRGRIALVDPEDGFATTFEIRFPT